MKSLHGRRGQSQEIAFAAPFRPPFPPKSTGFFSVSALHETLDIGAFLRGLKGYFLKEKQASIFEQRLFFK